MTTGNPSRTLQLSKLLEAMNALLAESEAERGQSYTLEELIEGIREERARILREKYGVEPEDE